MWPWCRPCLLEELTGSWVWAVNERVCGGLNAGGRAYAGLQTLDERSGSWSVAGGVGGRPESICVLVSITEGRWGIRGTIPELT